MRKLRKFFVVMCVVFASNVTLAADTDSEGKPGIAQILPDPQVPAAFFGFEKKEAEKANTSSAKAKPEVTKPKKAKAKAKKKKKPSNNDAHEK